MLLILRLTAAFVELFFYAIHQHILQKDPKVNKMYFEFCWYKVISDHYLFKLVKYHPHSQIILYQNQFRGKKTQTFAESFEILHLPSSVMCEGQSNLTYVYMQCRMSCWFLWTHNMNLTLIQQIQQMFAKLDESDWLSWPGHVDVSCLSTPSPWMVSSLKLEHDQVYYPGWLCWWWWHCIHHHAQCHEPLPSL